MQIATGIDALQIFDSHGGHLESSEFQEGSGRWMKEIVARLGRRPPALVPVVQPTRRVGDRRSAVSSSLGTHGNWPELITSGANVLGVDWQTDLAAAQIIPSHIGMQGNLSPTLIVEGTPEVVASETTKDSGNHARSARTYL